LPATEVDLPGQAARLEASVREAGKLALSMFQKPLNKWTKGEAQSPVSEADIATNDLLRERLTAGNDAVAWLSEESVDDPARLEARYVWIVDPIDGTRAYIGELPHWAVSVALVDNGRPIAACLYAPASDEFFMAVIGRGATRNGTAIKVTPGAALGGARIACPRYLIPKLQALLPPFEVMPRTHSQALRLARIAEGTFDASLSGAGSHDWDLAAADLLVHEAGGALTSFTGDTVTYNRAGTRHGMLAAAGRDRHAALLELIRDGRLAAP
jgi:myo-inositol-1(or 4)-monophosphatase